MNMSSLCKLFYLASSLLLAIPLLANAADRAHCADHPALAENIAAAGSHQEFLHYLNDIIAADELSAAPAVLDPALLARSADALRVCPQQLPDVFIEERIAIEALHNVASAFLANTDSRAETLYQQYGLEKMLRAEIHLLKIQQKPLAVDWHDDGLLGELFARHYAPSPALEASTEVAKY